MYYIISNIYIFIMYMNVFWGYLQVSMETREVRSQQGVQGREAVFTAVEQSCLGRSTILGQREAVHIHHAPEVARVSVGAIA